MMRLTETTTKDFRNLADEISLLMAYEVTRDLPLEAKEFETPICKTKANFIAGRSIGVDPMLATGGSAVAAIDFIKQRGCTDIKLMNLIAAPEGVKAVQDAHPDVDIYVASLDEKLNEHAYIVPGLGDAGDRLFGTK